VELQARVPKHLASSGNSSGNRLTVSDKLTFDRDL
jgi:hypothetical protein